MTNDINIAVVGSFKTKAYCQRSNVTGPLSRRSWGGMRDKPKNRPSDRVRKKTEN